jgi:hypothetical protein
VRDRVRWAAGPQITSGALRDSQNKPRAFTGFELNRTPVTFQIVAIALSCKDVDVTQILLPGFIVKAGLRSSEPADFVCPKKQLAPSVAVLLAWMWRRIGRVAGRQDGIQIENELVGRFFDAQNEAVLEVDPVEARKLGVVDHS